MSTMERYQPLGFGESVCGKVIRFAISYMISRDAWLNPLRGRPAGSWEPGIKVSAKIKL